MMRYLGDGSFIVGVPARDLTEAEAAQYGGVDALAATGLYLHDEYPGDPIQPIEHATLDQVIALYADDLSTGTPCTEGE